MPKLRCARNRRILLIVKISLGEKSAVLEMSHSTTFRISPLEAHSYKVSGGLASPSILQPQGFLSSWIQRLDLKI